MSRDIAVLMGGLSAEREVSLVSGNACAAALESRGHRVRRVDPGRDMAALVAALTPTPDVVFNALHGRFGEDGCVQGLLNLMGVPYTHSGLTASALAMDKPMAKRLFAAAGLPVAEDVVVALDAVRAGDPLPRPYVIKPPHEGSSVGVYLVQPDEPLPAFTGLAADAPVMVERYIPGRELTVAVMGDRPLAVTEIATGHVFYDYEAKYAAGGSVHTLPAPVPAPVYEAALDMAREAHRVLGCRGVSRTDFRWDVEGPDQGLYVLETNTQPGMTPTSLVPEQATHAGLDFATLVEWMVENASCDG